MESINELVKRTPLSLMILGVILILIAAIGGIPWNNSRMLITNPIYGYLLAVLGIILLGIGIYFSWQEYRELKTKDQAPQAQSSESAKTTPSLPALSPENGFLSIYVPKTNAARNSRKIKVIYDAERKIQLLATSGHSYLAVAGNRFKGQLVDRLEEGVPCQIILLNPWSDAAVFIAFGESISGLERQEHSAVSQMRRGILTGFDPVTFIEKSTYYKRKVADSIEGYLVLKKRFGELIELRFVDREITASILLTEKVGFFEPYINVNLQERMQNQLHTFEIEFSQTSYLATTCRAYFDTLWKLSIPYDEFVATEDKLKSKLQQKYQWKQ